jgi:hypothetical protein
MSFTAEETWRGGHYEIEMELGVPSDERLRTALQRIWSHPSLKRALKGCVFSRDQEPQDQVRVNLQSHPLESMLFGVTALPNGAPAACGTFVCRLAGGKDEPPRDLLSFYVPMGSIEKPYGIGAYPFSDLERAGAWRPQLDPWLAEIGRFVFEAVEFDLALVGWEVEFPSVSAESVKRSGVPAERYDGYLWRNGNGLEWHPPTNMEVVRSPGSRKREQSA